MSNREILPKSSERFGDTDSVAVGDELMIDRAAANNGPDADLEELGTDELGTEDLITENISGREDNNSVDIVPEATVDLAKQINDRAQHVSAERVYIDQIMSGNYPEPYAEELEALDLDEDSTIETPAVEAEDMDTDKIATEDMDTEPSPVMAAGDSEFAENEQLVEDGSREWDLDASAEIQAGKFPKLGYERKPESNEPSQENSGELTARTEDRTEPAIPSVQEKIVQFDRSILALQQELKNTSAWKLLRKASLRSDIKKLEQHKARYVQTYPELQKSVEPSPHEVLARFKKLVSEEARVRQEAVDAASDPAQGSVKASLDMQLRALRRQIEETRNAPGNMIMRTQEGLDMVGDYMASLAQYQSTETMPTQVSEQQQAAAMKRLTNPGQDSGKKPEVKSRDVITGVLERRAYTQQDPETLGDAEVDELYMQILTDRQRLLNERPASVLTTAKQEMWQANFNRLEDRRRLYGAEQYKRREADRHAKTRDKVAANNNVAA